MLHPDTIFLIMTKQKNVKRILQNIFVDESWRKDLGYKRKNALSQTNFTFIIHLVCL